MNLGETPWHSAASTQAVFALLAEAGYQVYAVGGCVRNAVLNEPASDVDFSTDALPEQVLKLGKAAGFKVVPTGIDHGTVTLVIDGTGFEVTTFRRDVETDGRRAVVAFADNIEADAIRRDFTMNAIYVDRGGMILDPLGGMPDLLERRVRFIGDAAMRIKEDALRILRFFRFYAQIGDPNSGLDRDGLAACAAHLDLLEGLSAERIGDEMRKLLRAPDPAPAVAAMAACGVLVRVLPGANPTALAPLIHEEGAETPRWTRRLTAMGQMDWSETLRLSKREQRQIKGVIDALNSPAAPAELGYRFGKEAAIDAALIRAASGVSMQGDAIEQIELGAAQAFPVTAHDLMGTIPPGPRLGSALRALEESWVKSGFRLTKAELIATLPPPKTGDQAH